MNFFCVRFAKRKNHSKKLSKTFYTLFNFKMQELIHNLSILIGTNEETLLIRISFFYFLPIIVQLFYKWFSRGLTIITLFLGWTPIPRVILTLNIIEWNKWIDEINDWIDEILENQEKIIKQLNLDLIINKQNNHPQKINSKKTWKSSN